MKLPIRHLLLMPVFVTGFSAAATELHPQSPWMPPSDIKAVRLTCKQVSTCEEAVILWCNGYSRADGDGDGIPCENVCSSLEEVNAIREKIGCGN
nr:excalibur calcium-binding domain-containing protein [uncultured Gellertiella sp.]